ncbi:MAG: PAS domain-containing protein [Rhodobacter sp.]|nr:PAS domain-containing protein [Paracoccaceae bacterium]MCC0075323.1 PAS domain-containing protein [Rhodobacter sp.]
MSDMIQDFDRDPGARGLPLSPAPIRFPAVASVQAHWEALRGGRTAPARAEIDPRPLAECLSVMFVAELVAPGVARLRLAGQSLGDLLGMEPRGMPLSVFVEQQDRDELADALQQVAQGVRVILPVRSVSGFARPALDGLLALMPLTDAQGRISRVLGVLETAGPVGRAPRRFSLGKPLAAGVAGAAPRPVRGRPTLRVIKGGRC